MTKLGALPSQESKTPGSWMLEFIWVLLGGNEKVGLGTQKSSFSDV